jgi:NTE family protein
MRSLLRRGATESARRSEAPEPTYAIALSGGGARGAYEAGVFHYIRTQLPPEIARKTLFKVYCGTSVGAINTSFLASSAHDPVYQGLRIRQLWQNLTSQDIYAADVQALTGFLVKSGLFMATNFFGLNHVLQDGRGPTNAFPFRSVLDTTPFVHYLRHNVNWAQLHRNIEQRVVDAITVSATHMATGQLALFVEKHPDVAYRSGGHYPITTAISPKHILASAAIPLIFPIIRVKRQFYGDGSLRQNTPMSPAIHLGGDRLLVVSMHMEQQNRPIPVLAPEDVEQEPKVADILGKLLNTIFLDKLDYDLSQMKRINYLIRDMERVFGDDAVARINQMRRDLRVPGKEINPLRKVQPFVIRPNADIGVIAYDHFTQLLAKRHTLTPLQRFFARMVEGSPEGHNDFISYLMFEKDYLCTLVDMGYEDTRREHEHLVRFLSGQPLDTLPATSPAAG